MRTRGSIGGYRLEAGRRLPPLLLDDDEAVAVAVGLQTAAGGAVTGIEETSLRALAKLEQVLPPRLRRRVNALQSFTVLIRRRARPTVDPRVLTRARRRVPRPRSAAVRLRRPEGAASHAATGRAVPPRELGPALVPRRVGHRPRATGARSASTGSVPRLPLGRRFTPRPLPDEDVAAYVARGVASAWRFRARIVVHAPAEVVAERIGPWVGTVEAIDDRTCILEAGANSVETMAVYLGMLDADFSVTEPPELVEHVRRLATRYGASTAA